MANMKLKTKYYYFEKFKASLLVFLIILCIVQVGILWSSQSDSLPISLFSDSYTEYQVASVDKSKGNYLLPYRVVISTGYDSEHYIIPNKSHEYNTLWEGAARYLEQALINKPKKTQPFAEEAWGTLVANKPYTFEFKTQIPIEIVKWALGIKGSEFGQGLTNIYKIVICPDDPDNSYSDTLYIRDEKNIYTYAVADFKDNKLEKKEFKKLYEAKKDDTSAKNYQMGIEQFAKIMASDLLGPLSHKSIEDYPSISCNSITGLKGQVDNVDDYKAVSESIFGKSGESRNAYPDVDVNGSAVLKKKDSIYRIHNNSIIEYTYIGSQGSTQKTNVLDAYNNAVQFIIGQHSLQDTFKSGISIYLTSYKESANSFEFNFDYSIPLGDGKGEVPILLKNYELPSDSKKQVNSCISVQVSSERVIHCNWLALKFEVGKSAESYSWDFINMQQKVIDANEELKNQESFTKDFGIYYVLSYPKTSENKVTPSFVLFTNDNSYDILIEEDSK